MKLISIFVFVFSLSVLSPLAENIVQQEDSEALADPSVNYGLDSVKRLKRGIRTARWHRVNNGPVCFGARGNSFGRFYVPGGRLAAIKLVHLYGYVSCHVPHSTSWSYWGCGDNNSPHGLNTLVNVVITTSLNRILLPPNQFIGQGHGSFKSFKWHKIPGYTSLSPELVLSVFAHPKWVRQNQELRLWYGEDLVNVAGDNGGRACVDVYALFV